MKNKKLLIGLGVIVILAIVGIGIYKNRQSKSSVEEVRIGAIIHLTGEASSLGQPLKNGLLLAYDLFNAQGGINGRNVRLIIEDSKNTAKGTIMAYNKLMADDVSAIITTGDVEYRAINACVNNDGRIPVIGTACTGGISDKSPLLYRYCYSEQSQDSDLAHFVVEGLALKKMVLFYPNNLYGQDILKYTQSVYENLGGKVVGVAAYNESAQDQKSLVAKMLDNKPDVICVRGIGIGFESIIKQTRELGFIGPLVGDITLGLPDVVQNNRDALNNCYYVASDIDRTSEDKVVVEYLNNYSNRYKTEGSFWDALTYDSYMLLATIMNDKTDCSLPAKLDAMKPIKGVLGTFAFNQDREIDFHTTVYVISNGESRVWIK